MNDYVTELLNYSQDVRETLSSVISSLSVSMSVSLSLLLPVDVCQSVSTMFLNAFLFLLFAEATASSRCDR